MKFYFFSIYGIVFLRTMNKTTVKTEAQKRASEKWENKFKQRILRIPLGKDKELVEHCKNKDESINCLLNRLIDEELKK
jgi:hypothetical protein